MNRNARLDPIAPSPAGGRTASATPAGPTAAGPTGAARGSRRVVDAPMRAFHALLGLSFALAWITAESERWRAWHIALGYGFGALCVWRLGMGLVGPRPARFAALRGRVRGTGAALREALRGRVDLRRGSALAMGWALMAMLALAVPLVASGWLGESSPAGLDGVLEALHEALASALLGAVGVHLTVLVLRSVLLGRNLARPMLTGRIEGPGPDLVAYDRRALAVVLVGVWVVGVVAQWAWG